MKLHLVMVQLYYSAQVGTQNLQMSRRKKHLNKSRLKWLSRYAM